VKLNPSEKLSSENEATISVSDVIRSGFGGGV